MSSSETTAQPTSLTRLARFDPLFRWITTGAALTILVILTAMVISLVIDSWESMQRFGFGFLWSTAWDPVAGEFGALTTIVGTLVSTLIAMLIAVPLAIGIAIFLSELSPQFLRPFLGTAIELLAAIPSIIYGMWGLFFLSPILADHVQPWLQDHFGYIPFFEGIPIGVGLMTAGIVLALMILPFMTSLIRDIFLMTPPMLKESAYGLGATTWEVIWKVVIPYGRRGIIAALFLGLGRGLGETMAVTFVIGNAHELGWSLFNPANTIASTLANEFTEASESLYLSSLVELGLILFLITFVVLSLAERWILSAEKTEGKR